MLAREVVNESFFSVGSAPALEVERLPEDVSTLTIVKRFYITGIPLSIATLSQLTFISVIVAVIGKYLGINELGGVSLALGLINATAFAFSAGLCGALETLLSYTYGIFQRKKLTSPEHDLKMYMYGTYVQRMSIILLVVGVPLGFTIVFTDLFLEMIGQNPEVVQFTGRFCRIAVFGVPSVQVFQLLNRYYACQHVTTPLSAAMIIASICNPFLQILCIKWIGFEGSPIAWVFMFTMVDAGLLLHTYYSGLYKLTWGGWDENALKNMKAMCKLAFPSMAMMMSEWVAFEINSICAGFSNPVDLAAFVISTQVLVVCWAVGSGIMMLVCVFIGNAIGEGRPMLGKRIGNIAICLILITSICNVCICFILEDFIPKLFTDEDAVVVVYKRLMRFLLPFHMVDSFQSTVLGILRGCGMQKTGSIIIAIALCGIGLPIGFFLFFYMDHGVESLWIGPLIGETVFGVPSYIYLVFWKIDWPNLKPQEEEQGSEYGCDAQSIDEQHDDVLEKEKSVTSPPVSPRMKSI